MAKTVVLIESAVPGSWQELEKTVTRILAECGMKAETEVEVATVRGKVVVDVYALDREQVPPATYISECKRWGSRISKGVVHGFRTVVQDFGANWGILISSKGFQSGAYEAAMNSNIKLVTWAEFQQLFAERWYRNTGAARVRTALDPLLEYTEPINSRIFRKADALPESARKEFIHLREEYRDFGNGLLPLWIGIPGFTSGPMTPKLPLRAVLDKRQELRPRIPDAVLDAHSLRDFISAVEKEAAAAIKRFDKVFGGRA